MPGRHSYHPEAREELRESYAWYLARNVSAADEFLERALTLVDLAVDFPDIGAPYLHGTRRLLFRDFPFMIVYRVRRNLLEVIAIAHTSRRPGYWRDRLD